MNYVILILFISLLKSVFNIFYNLKSSYKYEIYKIIIHPVKQLKNRRLLYEQMLL